MCVRQENGEREEKSIYVNEGPLGWNLPFIYIIMKVFDRTRCTHAFYYFNEIKAVLISLSSVV